MSNKIRLLDTTFVYDEETKNLKLVTHHRTFVKHVNNEIELFQALTESVHYSTDVLEFNPLSDEIFIDKIEVLEEPDSSVEVSDSSSEDFEGFDMEAVEQETEEFTDDTDLIDIVDLPPTE